MVFIFLACCFTSIREVVILIWLLVVTSMRGEVRDVFSPHDTLELLYCGGPDLRNALSGLCAGYIALSQVSLILDHSSR